LKFSSIVQREAKICSQKSARSALRLPSVFAKKSSPVFILPQLSQIWQETGSIFLAKNLAFLTHPAF
jgi:hypothetical protein